MYIRAQTCTIMSFNDGDNIVDIVVAEEALTVRAVTKAAEILLTHPDGGKVRAVKFLQNNLHPLHSFKGISLRQALDIVNALQAEKRFLS